MRAWLAAGRPSGKARLGSYEDADVEGAAWREFTAVWWEQHRDAELRVADLVDLCEMNDLMLHLRGDGSTRSQQSRLGRALQGARDRVFGDLQVTILN